MIAAVLFATPTASAGPQAVAGADGFSALMALATAPTTSAPVSTAEDATVSQDTSTEDTARDPALLALAMAPWLTPVTPPTVPVVEAPVVEGGAEAPVLMGGKAKPAAFLGAATTSPLSTPVVLPDPTTVEALPTQLGPVEGDGAAAPTPIGTPIALPKAPTPANDVGTKELLTKPTANAPAKAATPSPGTLKTTPRMDAPTLPKAPVVAPQAKPPMATPKPVAPSVQAPSAPTQPAADAQTMTQPPARAAVSLAAQTATALAAPQAAAPQAAAPQAAATPTTATRLAPKLARVVPLSTKPPSTTTPIEPTATPTLEPRVEPTDLDDFRRAFAEPKPEPTITVTTLQQEKPVAKEAAPHAPAATAPPAARFEELDPTRLVRNEAFVRASSVMSLRRGATGEVRSPELGLVSVSAVPYAHGRIEVQVDAARPTTGALLVEHRAALVETVREVAGGANVHVGQHGMGAGGQKQSSKQPSDQTETEPPIKVASGGRRSRFVL